VLEVVEDEQDGRAIKAFVHRREEIDARRVAEPERRRERRHDLRRIAQPIRFHQPDPSRVPLHERGRRREREPGLAHAAEADQRDDAATLLERCHDLITLPVAADQRADGGGEVGRPDVERPRRREVARGALVDAQMEQPPRHREVLEPVQPQIVAVEAVAEQRVRHLAHQHLTAMRRVTDPRRAMDLYPEDMLAAALERPGMQAHAYAHLADLRGPVVCAQRPLRHRRRLCRGGRALERREERVPLGPLDLSARREDRRFDEPVMLAQHVRPAGAGQPRQPRRALDVREQHRHVRDRSTILADGLHAADLHDSTATSQPARRQPTSRRSAGHRAISQRTQSWSSSECPQAQLYW
jgi:hypothetical protein